MEFLETVRKRRSIRRFTDRAVPDSIIRKIIEVGVHAPTSCNQQLWRFIVVKDNATKERLIKEAFSSTLIRRAPVVIFVTYDSWNYKESIQASSMAVLNMLLAATDLGVGSLAMNSYGADNKIKKVLKIPDSYQICCCVCLGYPTEAYNHYPQVPRRDAAEVIDYSTFDQKNFLPHSYDPRNWELGHLIDYQRFYCRKTFLGKEMDINNRLEKELVKKALADAEGPMLDLFSYDGSYLSLFPNVPVHALDLTEETSRYTQEAARMQGERKITRSVYDPKAKQLSKKQTKTVTLIYKAERLPSETLARSLCQACETLDAGGKIIVVARRSSLLFNIFYGTVRILFGDDIRKTGIYAFFGPYRPVRSGNLRRAIEDAGFVHVRERRYFPIPAFFDQAFQMFLQYRKSDGSSYLHRMRHENILTRLLAGVLKLQGLRQLPFGSVSVFEAGKR